MTVAESPTRLLVASGLPVNRYLVEPAIQCERQDGPMQQNLDEGWDDDAGKRQ